MKLISTYTPSHTQFKDEWFLPSLQDDYDVSMYSCDIQGSGKYKEADWVEGILFKNLKIIETIKENMGSIFIYSDVDLQFFAPTKQKVLNAIKGKDVVCQLDDLHGNLCAGFIAIRANTLTLELWQKVHAAIKTERRDQMAFNRIIREMKEISFGCLPVEFFGTGTFNAQIWTPGGAFYIPPHPVMYHANWVEGVDQKVVLLKQVKKTVEQGRLAIAKNNARFYLRYGLLGLKSVLLLKYNPLAKVYSSPEYT